MWCNKIPGQKRRCRLEVEQLSAYDQYFAVKIENVQTAVKRVNHHEEVLVPTKQTNRNLNGCLQTQS